MRAINTIGMVSSLGVAIALLATPAAAAAQAAPAEQPAAAGSDGSAASDSKNAKDGEIVVTAERKEQNLQKYGGTAVVLSGKTLKSTGVQNITDLEGRIPGLDILANNNNVEVYIRGVGSSNNTELGDPAAGTHYDGVYIPRPAGFGSIFYDIDRVEVNIGPQGTLRGRNATAGTVNIIPWHPGLNIFDAYVETGIGNYGQNSQEAALNVPVTENLAVRLSGEHSYHHTYTHNVGPTQGLRGPEWENNFSGRFQVLYKPSDQFDMLLSFDNTAENGGGVIGTNLSVAEGAAAQAAGVNVSNLDLRTVYLYPTDPHQHTVHSGEKGEFNYHAKAFDIQFTASHRHLNSDFIGAPPGLVAYPNGLAQVNAGDPAGDLSKDWAHYETQGLSNSDTQELRFTAPKGSRFEWTVGGFHFNESQASFFGTVASQNAYFQGIEFNTRTQSQSWAGYTDDTFHVNSKLSLTGGIRYTDDSKQRTGVAARYLLALGAADYNCCFGPIIGSPGFQFAGLSRTNYTLPNANLPGSAQAQQALDFYLNGIKSFGKFDTVPTIFPNGQIPTVPTGPCVPNPQTSYLQCAANGKYTYATIDSTEFFQQNASDHYHFIDWRVRGQYEFNADHMVYGLIATGNKSGGFNDNFGTGGIAPTYRPERVTNFEIGTKNRFTIAGNPVKFNLSGFYEDYHDQVLSSLLSIASAASFASQSGQPITFPSNFTPGAIIVNFNYNAANSKIAGAQFDGAVTIPAAKLNLSFNALWLPVAKVTSSQSIEDFRFQSDIDGNDAGFRSIQNKRLPRTPRFQINMQLSQKFETKHGSFDYVIAPGYRSSTYATIFNGQDYAFSACQAGGTVTDVNGKPVAGCSITTTYRGRLNDTVPGYWTLDLGAGYSSPNGRLRVEGYVNNILYKGSISGILISQTGGTVAFLPRPVTYGGRVRVRF